MNQYKLNLFLPLISAVFIMFFITILGFIYFQEDNIHENKRQIPDKFFYDLELKSQYDTNVFSNFIDTLQSDESVIKTFESKDKKELFNLVKPLFDKLNKDIDLTHFYFILNDGTVLLRVHNFDKDGDIIKRTTFLTAQKENALSSGLEFGLMKNYTLRVVKPWIVNGKTIGYIELGKEIDKTISNLSKLLDTQIYLAVKKDIFKNAPEEVKNILNSKISTKNYYIEYHTTVVPNEIEDILNGKLNNKDISLKDNDYLVSLAPMTDVSKKHLGSFVFLSNVSKEHSLMYGSIQVLSILFLLLTLILIAIGFTLIKRSENRILNLTTRLDKKNEKLQKLFDVQRNMIVISDGKNTTLVNRAILNFFDVDNIDEFKRFHNDISEKFINANGYFSLEKIQKNDNWIKAIEPLLGDKRIVTMQDSDSNPHAFNISISQFENEKYLISFTDISATMIEKVDLSKKIERDELTNTFNRKFLNNNFVSIIKSLDKDTYIGVALLDIDFFKKVNDTHGHNVGDIVLKQFSQYVKSSIRANDFLIRWGGEEFIVLIRTTSDKALLKTAEHIRQRIENSSFNTVGNITCSIGITLHTPGEDIHNAIERADKALYESKESGRNKVTQSENINNDKVERLIEKKFIKAVLDENAIIVDFEANVLDKGSYLPEEVLGKNWFEVFVSENDKQKVQDYFNTMISGPNREIDRYTNDIVCKDGTHRLLDFDNTVFTQDGEKFISFVAKEHFFGNVQDSVSGLDNI